MGYLAAAFSIVVWGVTFVNTRALLGEFSSFEIMVVRFALAWAALWLMSDRRERWLTFTRLGQLRPRHFLYIGMGLCGVVLYQFLENCAIFYTGAGNVAILMSISPVVNAVLARLVGREGRFGPWMWAGSVLAIAGAAAVSLANEAELEFHIKGDLMVLGTVVSWGVYSILMDMANSAGMQILTVTRKSFFWSLVMMLPVAVWGTTAAGRAALDGTFGIRLDAAVNAARFANPVNLLNFAFLGVCASALGFVFWNFASKRIGMVKASVGLYLMPLVGVLAAALFLGERISAGGAVGGLLIVAGVAISNLDGFRNTPKPVISPAKTRPEAPVF